MSVTSPLFELVGFRHTLTGTLIRSSLNPEVFARMSADDEFEPVFTGADPQLVAPLLEALINLVDDRSESASKRSESFLWHKLRAQQALSEFVDAGGEIP